MTSDSKTTPATAQRPCPVCGVPIDPANEAARRFRPFCSRICSDVDLLRWLRGGYVIPGNGSDDDEDGDAGRNADEAGETADGASAGGRDNGR